MIDTLLQHRRRSERSTILEDLHLAGREYVVLTLHRPASVDAPEVLDSLISAIMRVSRELPVVFPVHPRTAKVLKESMEREPSSDTTDLRLVDPLGYLDFLKLLSHARLVMTDSGGIQEESTVLGVPCLTLRTSTERPATITEGTNQLIGLDPKRIVATAFEVLRRGRTTRRVPELWDGHASRRIVDALERGQAAENAL